MRGTISAITGTGANSSSGPRTATSPGTSASTGTVYNNITSRITWSDYRNTTASTGSGSGTDTITCERRGPNY